MAGLTFMLPDSCLIVTYRCPVVSRLVMEIIEMLKRFRFENRSGHWFNFVVNPNEIMLIGEDEKENKINMVFKNGYVISCDDTDIETVVDLFFWS